MPGLPFLQNKPNFPKLKDRLHSIDQGREFGSFFSKFSGRPPYSVKENTVIFNEGEPLDRLYFIIEGFVKLYRLSEEGREATIYLYGPGDVLGIRALTSNDHCAKHNAEALTNLKLISMTHKEYFEAVTKNPGCLVDLLHLFINRLNYTEKKVEGFILTDTTARVSNFLLDIATRFCNLEDQPVTLPLPLTHQRIAEFVGSFRETVTLSLNKLEKEKIIKIEKKQLTILDPDKLRYLSQSCKR